MAMGKGLSCDICAVSLDLPAAVPLFVLRVHFMRKCKAPHGEMEGHGHLQGSLLPWRPHLFPRQEKGRLREEKTSPPGSHLSRRPIVPSQCANCPQATLGTTNTLYLEHVPLRLCCAGKGQTHTQTRGEWGNPCLLALGSWCSQTILGPTQLERAGQGQVLRWDFCAARSLHQPRGVGLDRLPHIPGQGAGGRGPGEDQPVGCGQGRGGPHCRPA